MKKITSLIVSVVLASSLFADDAYFGVSYGAASTSKTVYGNASDTDETPVYYGYDNVSLTGISFSAFSSFNDDTFLIGIGADGYFNKGDFIKGGTLESNLKIGGAYNDFKGYALLGYGIQSLSSYTVAVGVLYGVGARYDIFKHLSASIEYRKHQLETTENDDATAHQKYELSGVYFSADYRF